MGAAAAATGVAGRARPRREGTGMSASAGDRCIVQHKEDCDGVPYPWRAVFYYCPGCRAIHNADLREAGRAGPSWTFNEDRERPTLSPSVFYTTRVCHHFVQAGMIQFLGDCTHALAGQTVELPAVLEWPAGLRDSL